jgi:hypothetical protein
MEKKKEKNKDEWLNMAVGQMPPPFCYLGVAEPPPWPLGVVRPPPKSKMRVARGG